MFTPFKANGDKKSRVSTQNPIDHVNLKEIQQGIRSNMNFKQAQDLVLITVQILEELPKSSVLKFLHIFNATLRLNLVPRQWKFAEIIMKNSSADSFHYFQ